MYKFLLVFYCLITSTAWADKGSIRGIVYDRETNLPLAGATILLVGNGKNTASDVFGTFQFSGLPAQSYKLKISFLGYESQLISLEVKENETTTLTSSLPATYLELSEVNVSPKLAGSTNSIQGVDLKLRPTRSAQDMLRIIPGLFIAQHAGGGKAEQIFLRGFDIDHGTDINLTVDGMPVNMVSHAHGQGYADLHFLIPETVEMVDFGKGPYFTNKGDFTTAGYVNFHTKNSLTKNIFKVESGQFNTYRAVSMLDLLGKKAKNRKQNAYLASEYFFSNGYCDSPQHFNRLNLFGKYNHYIDDNTILNLSFSTFNSKWDASGQIPQRAIDKGIIGRFGAIDPTEGGTTRRTNANLQFTTIFSDGSTLTNQLYFTRYQFELYSNFTFFLHDSIHGDQLRQKEIRNLTGYLGTYQRQSTIVNKELLSEVGFGVRYDAIQDNELSRTKARRNTICRVAYGDIGQLNTYAYVDENLNLSPRFTLNAGLRLDAFNFAYLNKLDRAFHRKTLFKQTISPKLNLYYDHNARLHFFIKSGIGFHSNDARVAILQQGHDILPKAYGAEIGLVVKPTPRLVVNTSLWHLKLDQEFVYVGDEAVIEPGGRTRRVGIDFSLRYQLCSWLFADGDINITRPRNIDAKEGSQYIPLAPVLSSIGGLTFRLQNGLNGSLRYRFLGDRPANDDNSVIARGYLLADAVITFTKPRYEVGFSIENLTNVAWKEAQFLTESQLRGEKTPVSEIHFTPGSPFFLKACLSYFF